MNMYPIEKWPAQDAADDGQERFIPTGKRPSWARTYSTDAKATCTSITVAGDPVEVELQEDHQLDGTVHLAQETDCFWLPGCLNTFTFSPEIVVANASDGTELVKLSVSGARDLAAVLVQLADKADAEQAR